MKNIYFIFILICHRNCTILSKSELHHCYVDSTENCQQKILLNFTVENSQKNNSEKVEFVLNEFVDQHEQQVKLETPLTITMSQKGVKVYYKLIYRQHFSEQVYEKIISSVYPFCSEGILKDDQIMNDSTCGFVKDSDGKPIINSQGFCCSCPLMTILTGLETEHHRGNCGFFDQTDTAHCLVFSNELYSAYQIQQYYYEYQIDINLKGFDNNLQQDIDITETLSQSSRSKSNDFFVVKIIGNFLPSENPVDLEGQILLLPSFIKRGEIKDNKKQDEQFSQYLVTQQDKINFINKSLVVNDNQISWDGQYCDKIGVSYSAFHNQNNKCQMQAGTCLNNQIKDLYIQDIKRLRNNQEALYLLSSKGQFEDIVQNDQGVQLKMDYQHVFTTQITLEVNASEMRFITYLGQAQIISAQIEDVNSEQQFGLLKAEIQNISNYAASFEVQLKCSEFIEQIPSNIVSLEPQDIEYVQMEFQVQSQQAQEHWCELNILNTKGQLVESEKIIFQGIFREVNIQQQELIEEDYQKVFYDESAQKNDDKIEYDNLNKEIICQYLCPEMTGIACFVINTCTDKLKQILILLSIIIFVVAVSILLFIKCCGVQILDFFIKLGFIKNNKIVEKQQNFQQVDIEQKVLPSQQYLQTDPVQNFYIENKRHSLSLQKSKNNEEIKLCKSQQEIDIPEDVENCLKQ